MSIRIDEVGSGDLPEYSKISIAFEVRSILQIHLVKGGLGGIQLVEEPVPCPYTKDYDSYEDGPPDRWPSQLDVANWGFLLAREDGRPVGGATIAFDTPGLIMTEGRNDLAVLWDIRVQPDARRSGIGKALFDHVIDWSRERGCGQLKIETQNVNVPACRFYEGVGCRLGRIDRYGYGNAPEVAHEVMLIWHLVL